MNEENPPSGELLIYAGKDGRLRVQAPLRDETLWLTQRQIKQLESSKPKRPSKNKGE